MIEAAISMRVALGFGVDERGPTFTEALRHLAEEAEEAGILVMVNGVVGSNTHRKLDRRSSAALRWSMTLLRWCS